MIDFIKSELLGSILQRESDKLVRDFVDSYTNIIKDLPDDPDLNDIICNSLISAFCAKLIKIRTEGCAQDGTLTYFDHFCVATKQYISFLQQDEDV